MEAVSQGPSAPKPQIVEGKAIEEQFILRFADPSVADRVRRALREEEPLGEGGLEISFPDSGRQGQLVLEGSSYNIDVLTLPTVVESYKTLDDEHIVKTGDIGQVLLVGSQIRDNQVESDDGVTVAMRNARKRHFRELPDVEPDLVANVEADMVNILVGRAPKDIEYYDIEEEWVVDKEGNGSWKPAKKKEAPAYADYLGFLTEDGIPTRGRGRGRGRGGGRGRGRGRGRGGVGVGEGLAIDMTVPPLAIDMTAGLSGALQFPLPLPLGIIPDPAAIPTDMII